MIKGIISDLTEDNKDIKIQTSEGLDGAIKFSTICVKNSSEQHYTKANPNT